MKMQTLFCEVCKGVWERKPTPGTRPKTCSSECAAIRKKMLDQNYYQSNRAKILDQVSKYQEENKDAIKKYLRSYYEKHQEEIKTKSEKYRIENAEEVAKWQRDYRERNRDQLAKYFRDYAAKNKNKINAWSRSRRAREAGASEWEVLMRESLPDHFGWLCHICSGEIPKDVDRFHPLYLTMDHVIPLFHGGNHTLENVLPAHASCNKQKGAKLDGWQNIKPIIPEVLDGAD